MFKENREFYTELEFVHKYNIKTNFLQFNGLKAAIKVFAKKLKLDTILGGKKKRKFKFLNTESLFVNKLI